MKHHYFLIAGLALVFIAIAMRLFSFEHYAYALVPGIALKVVYLGLGIFYGRLAGGIYLGMLLTGIAMVGGGSWLKAVAQDPAFGFWIMMTGFLLKSVSIVFIVVVGRKQRMNVETRKNP